MRLIAPPVEPVLTVQEAKAWARVDHSGDDWRIPMMVEAATLHAEHEAGLRLITQTWREDLRDWPLSDQTFAQHPVQSVALRYYDGALWNALDPATAVALRTPTGVVVQRAIAGSYPGLTSYPGSRVQLDFVVGYGDTSASVPAPFKVFIAAHVAYWIRNVEAAHELKQVESVFLSRLLDPFRTFL